MSVLCVGGGKERKVANRAREGVRDGICPDDTPPLALALTLLSLPSPSEQGSKRRKGGRVEVCQIGVVWELHKNGRAHSLEATQPEPANQPNTGVKSRMLVDHRPHRTVPCHTPAAYG